jgi:hypothetical protein
MEGVGEPERSLRAIYQGGAPYPLGHDKGAMRQERRAWDDNLEICQLAAELAERPRSSLKSAQEAAAVSPLFPPIALAPVPIGISLACRISLALINSANDSSP